MNGKEKLLYDIGVVSFVVVDLGLYLDTHPTDCKAMEYYNHYNHIRKQLMKEFSEKYYPLTMDMAECSKEWKWVMAPMPWEGECG